MTFIARTARRATLAILILLAAGVLAGVRRVPDEPGALRLRRWLGGSTQRLEPGWTLVPPLVATMHVVPLDAVTATIRGGGEGRNPLHSVEGASVLVYGRMAVAPDPDRIDRFVAAFDGRWTPDRAGTLLSDRLASPIADHARSRSIPDLLLPPDEGAALEIVVERAAGEIGVIVEGTFNLGFYPMMEGDRSSGASGGRVLLIGLDGADWDIVDPLMDSGAMPNLAGLVDNGVRARLRTITPALSPIVWTSIATGFGPERHGILDFFATTEDGDQIPVTSGMRRVKALWNILSETGRSSGVIAWWATWPAEAVDGFIVSDRVAYQLFGFGENAERLRQRTYPEALSLAIQPRIVAPTSIEEEEVARFIPVGPAAPEYTDHAERLKTNLASTRTYLDIGLELLGAYRPDFQAIYFEGTDTIAHYFMRYRPPSMAGVTREELEAYGEVVDRYYVYADEILGRLLELVDDETTVIVCSDHGFRTGLNRPSTDPRIEMGGAADWHRRFGVLVVSGPRIREGERIPVVSVLDVAPTVLALLDVPVPEDMDGRVLTELFEVSVEPRRVATYETGGTPDEPVPEASPVDDEILEKLTALGYVSQQGSNALNNTGITLLERGRYSEAADAFRRALDETPGFVAARINLGRAQMLLKDTEAALSTFRAVLRDDPRRVEVHNLIGNILMEQGDLTGAEASFRRSLAIEPTDTDTRNSLGLLYHEMDRDDEAIAEYRKVLAVDPDYAEGYNNIGIIERERGRLDEAIEMFELSIRADPAFPGGYNNMGLAYQDQGRLDEARDVLLRGLEVDPRSAVILNSLGTTELAAGQSEAARRFFEQAIEADPEYPAAHNNLGAVLGMLGDMPGSMEMYHKAVLLDPDYIDARFNLSRAYTLEQRHTEAREELSRILEIDDRYYPALLQLAVLDAMEGRGDSGIDRARRAAAIAPNSPEPINLLADLYMRAGRTREARSALERSLMIDPNQPLVRQTLRRLGMGEGNGAR